MEDNDTEYESGIYFKTKNYGFTEAILDASISGKLEICSLYIAPKTMTSSFIVFTHEEGALDTLKEICSNNGIELV